MKKMNKKDSAFIKPSLNEGKDHASDPRHIIQVVITAPMTIPAAPPPDNMSKEWNR